MSPDPFSAPGNGTLDERLYALQDANWNVTAITDENGDVQERYAYSAYGVFSFLSPTFAARSSSDFDWETLYAGYQRDSRSDLFVVRERIYHPLLGLWGQRDPIGYRGGLNLFEYTAGGPVSSVDPHGRQPPVRDALCARNLCDC